MSDLLHDDDLRTEREPVKEPAKRWRNWYRNKTNRPVRIIWNDGSDDLPSGVFPGEDWFPSFELAEQHALEFIEACTFDDGALVEWLGAYPEGERP